MDLLQAARSGSLKNVEEAVKSQGIWTDYEALNIALTNGNIDIAKFLLSQNCRVNKPFAADQFEFSPLHRAVKLKNVDLIKLLLQSGASITAAYRGGNTPLHLAFIAGLSEIVNVLLDYISESSEIVNCMNDFGLSHLHIACTTGNSEVIKKYFKANVNINDAVNEDSPKWAGYTAYHFAIEYRSPLAIYTLSNIRYCVQKMQEDKTGQTPWDLACARLVENSTMTHIMSKHNVCREDRKSYYFQGQSGMPMCKDVDHPTAFHLACMGGDSHLVKAFLERGAPVNIPVSKSMKICPLYSPLHFAVESGCKKSVELLLEYGADVTSVNGYNMTALHLSMYNNGNIARDCLYLENASMTKLLYSKVVDKEKNLKDDNKLSYFHIAVAANDLELVKKMLEGKRVKVNSQVLANIREFSLFTPLHFAVESNNHEMVKLLVQHGADPNIVSSRGTTLQMALNLRSSTNEFGAFDVLLNLGVKVDVTLGQKTLLHHVILHALEIERERSLESYESGPYKGGLFYNYIGRIIELGCDVNAKDEHGDTALHLAIDHDMAMCCKALVENGADVSAENNEGECPDLFTSYSCEPESEVVYEHVQNIRALGWKVHPQHDKTCDLTLKKMKDIEESGGVHFLDDLRDLTELEKKKEDEKYQHHRLVGTHRYRHWEIKKMKKVKLDEMTTLYDFMRLEGESLGVYAGNEMLKSIVDGLVGEDRQFSVYGYLIKLQYRKSQKYAETKVTIKRSSSSEASKEDLPKRKRVT